MRRIFLSTLYLVLVSTGAAFAEKVDSLSAFGYVNDYAGLLPRGEKDKIENLLKELEEKTTAEVSVVTVKTISPLTVEQYAVELFEKWGIGKKGKDNGVLLLVAVGEKKVRIEVGYGLEGAITDLESKLIIEEKILPFFRKGDFPAGIVSGANTIAALVYKSAGVEPSAAIPAGAGMVGGKDPYLELLPLIIFILIFGFNWWIGYYFARRARKLGGYYGGSYWSGGGSFGGGFGGFGGGGSGGGGASGGW